MDGVTDSPARSAAVPDGRRRRPTSGPAAGPRPTAGRRKLKAAWGYGWLVCWLVVGLAPAPIGAADATVSLPDPRPPAGGEPGRGTVAVANLLRDGSMEAVEGDRLLAWHLSQARDGAVVMGPSRDAPRDGAFCMSLRGIGAWACGEGERIPVTAGRTYTLQGYARATRGDVFLQISYWGQGKWLGCTQSEAVATDGDWQLCTAVSELDRFPEAVEVSISGTTRGGNVEAWFDALVFAVGNPPPAPEPRTP